MFKQFYSPYEISNLIPIDEEFFCSQLSFCFILIPETVYEIITEKCLCIWKKFFNLALLLNRNYQFLWTQSKKRQIMHPLFDLKYQFIIIKTSFSKFPFEDCNAFYFLSNPFKMIVNLCILFLTKSKQYYFFKKYQFQGNKYLRMLCNTDATSRRLETVTFSNCTQFQTIAITF